MNRSLAINVLCGVAMVLIWAVGFYEIGRL
jgi:hypothetical protein